MRRTKSDVDGRPARRVFCASLCGGEGRRRAAVARYVARGSGRRRGESHDRFAVGESDSLCPVAVERRQGRSCSISARAARPYQRGFEGAAGQCRHRRGKAGCVRRKTVGSVHMPLPTAFCSAGFRSFGRTIRSPRFAPDSGFRFRGTSCLPQDGIHREMKDRTAKCGLLFVAKRVAYLITTTRLFSMLPLKG